MLWNNDFFKEFNIPMQRSFASITREEIAHYGIESVSLAGVFAAIIGNVPDETMKSLMEQGLRKVAAMTPEEFMAMPGIGKEKTTRLTASFELARRLARLMPEDRPAIKSPKNASALVMEEMRHLDREHFWALLLNAKNQVLAREVVSIGTLNFSAVHPREIFKAAIKRSAAGIILVHNHPSGDPTPSSQDIEATNRIVEAGNIVGIDVLDHLVIGDNKFTSFKAQGLI